MPTPKVILLTGIQAAGKSTVAQLLAERLSPSVHVRGDMFRRMIVNGRAEMTPQLSDQALRQLRLRYELTASTLSHETSFSATIYRKRWRGSTPGRWRLSSWLQR